jgi:hypothetical protein
MENKTKLKMASFQPMCPLDSITGMAKSLKLFKYLNEVSTFHSIFASIVV